MHSFARTLREAIWESGLSLREVADRCQQQCNVAVDNSYLSKLQLGACPPPSDKITRALAQVLGLDLVEFALQAYIDRAPEDLRGRLVAMC
jgi:transcriptional regulator with XRE-family HTH domain